MKVSVVTISFNQRTYLKQTIESILHQSHSDVEYIICDPGSTDGSRELIASCGDRIVRVFEEDNGPADGLNRGFARTTGEILCYVNSDDYLLPGTLDYVQSFFELHKDIDVIYGHCHVINKDGKFLRYAFSDRYSSTRAAYGAAIVIQPSTFFRRSAFERTQGFNASNKSNWDGELFIDLVLNGARIQRVNKFLSAYRIHNEGITGSGRLEHLHLMHSQRMFRKIIGRDQSQSDTWMFRFQRAIKHVINPRATLERLIRGPVFGSSK